MREDDTNTGKNAEEEDLLVPMDDLSAEGDVEFAFEDDGDDAIFFDFEGDFDEEG